MSESSEPRWELLPNDPEEFFQLGDDYDLRDLKRSYNRLIRRYKPEKHPEEFQRIRAAYESLNDTLRYNLPSRKTESHDWPVDLDVPAPMPEPATSSPVTRFESPQTEPDESAPVPLEEQIESASPCELYAQFKSRTTKTSSDYVALALLSDLLLETDAEHASEESFVEWILAGIASDPHDWGLTGLLREYLAEDVSLEEIPALLLQAAQRLQADRFQYTTERAWDRLLREVPFEQFSDCLRQCGEQLGRAIDHSQLVFYLHVLKLAIWKADDEFICRLQEAIEDHFHTLDGWAQEEYEMICALLDYKATREVFVRRGPCCQRIDQAIRDWCVLPETEGDLSVLEAQYFLSMRAWRFLDEFPEITTDIADVMAPWERIVEDVMDRLGDPQPLEETTLAQYARDFMIRVTRRNKETYRYHYGFAVKLGAIAIALVALVATGSFLVRMGIKIFGQFQILSGLLDLLIAGATLIGGTIVGLIVYVISEKYTKPRYELVRGELIKFLRVAPLPIDQLVASIKEQEDETFDTESFGVIDDTEAIADGLEEDVAMELFSLAQVCLSAAAPEETES